jgi:hypothetical protein
VSLIKRLRTVLLCLALEVGVLSGVPMRPEQIRELLNQLNQPKLAHVLPGEEDSGDGSSGRNELTKDP